MNKKITLVVFLSLFISFAFAQKTSLITDAQSVKLQAISNEFQLKSDANRKKAFELAAINNWVIFRVEKDGTVIALQGVDDLGFPLYLKTFNNTTAAGTTRTNSLYTGGSLGLSLNGSSDNLIGRVGIWDGGSVLLNHQEFSGGRVEQKDNPSSSSEHSTHVAGTMMAAGVNPAARGMAWGLKKLYAWDFNSDLAEMTKAAAAGMAISNHSYGYIAGWNYNSDESRWEWYGVPGATEDYKFGFYDDSARDWDIICYNAPYYLPVKSVGNNKTENGPAVGQPYYGFNSASSSTLVAKGNRPAGISDNAGYDIISTTGNAKNILTVGAVSGLPFGASDPSQIQIAAFSSWGPTDDGRIKPDIVADGVQVTSTSDADTKSYAVLSGTSMSSPNVSGSLVLLQEYYAQLNNGSFLRSSTLKGLVIETADEAGTAPGPDYVFGWGLLNMERAATLIKQNGAKSLIAERTLAQGQTSDLQVITSGYGPLKATICWTDPEGTPATSGTLNSRTPKLVNDLDLRLIKGSVTALPWRLNPNAPSSAAIQADNSIDNVEQISIPNSVPGQTYTIRVSHKGTLIKGPQNYSLIVSGVGGLAYCTSTASSATDSRIDNFQMGTINNTAPNTCRAYTDYTSISTDLEAGKTYPFTINIGSCGANAAKIAKLFIDWNVDGDFNDVNETIATSTIINGAGAFSGSLNVPSDVIPGNSSILRIVLAEGNDPDMVNPCGVYAKGETQDYMVNFKKSSVDAGVIALNNITDNLCPNTEQNLTVRLKNFGSSTLNNIPVEVTLTNNSTVIKSFTENFTESLPPNNEVDFTLSGNFSVVASQQYTINVKTTLSTDAVMSNNGISKTFNVSVPENPTSLSASFCSNSANSYQLNGQADGTLFWYSSSNSIMPVAFGNNTTSTTAPDHNDTFYAGLNDFKSYFGAKNKKQYTGGTYSSNFGPKPQITVGAPMVLDSAILYTSKAGQLIFTVENLSGVILSSYTINVERSKTTADMLDGNNQVMDDENDRGKAYKLGLVFPAAGTYRIGISYNEATIFRSNSGVTNVPISIAEGLISLNGAYFDNGSGSPTVITTSYYYFYNMLFKSLGCTNYNKIPVKINTPEITQTDSILNSNFDFSNQWYLDGTAIEGATNKTFTPTRSGIYRVDVVSPTGCVSSSEDFNYFLSFDGIGIGLSAYPVPSDGMLNVRFIVVKDENVSISLTNLLGQKVLEKQMPNFSGKYFDTLNLNHLDNGVYILNVKVGRKSYIRKITISK